MGCWASSQTSSDVFPTPPKREKEHDVRGRGPSRHALSLPLWPPKAASLVLSKTTFLRNPERGGSHDANKRR